MIHIIKSKKSKKFYFNKLFRGVYINTDKFLKDILYYRCIGPFRGGRVVAVVGDPKDANIFYFGACAGGVWKTYDGGLFWENISDNYFNSASIGAIAVSD